jgi:uncharacterized protein YjbI with pentapeptide repeats
MLMVASDDLAWNIEVLIGSINSMRLIRGVDMSQTVLSQPILDGFGNIQRRALGFNRGVVFENVRLSGASLAGMYVDSVVFRSTALDSAVLAGTLFDNCTFEGSNLAGFRVDLSPRGFGRVAALPELDSTTFVLAAQWDESTLNVEDFYTLAVGEVIPIVGERVLHKDWYFIIGTS